MSAIGDNLATVVAAWTGLVRFGDPKPLAAALAEHVTWQGVQPELTCQNRSEVMTLVGRFATRRRRIVRLEAQESGNRVAISVEGPDFPEMADLPLGSTRSIVFTFADGKIGRMESFASRDEAFDSLG